MVGNVKNEFRLTIHTIIGVAIMAYIALPGYLSIKETNESLLSAMETAFNNDQKSINRFTNASSETRLKLFEIVLESESDSYKRFQSLAESYSKVLGFFATYSIYILVMQIIYLLLYMGTNDIEKSAITHCTLGLLAWIAIGLVRGLGDQSGNVLLEDSWIIISYLVLLFGLVRRSRIVSVFMLIAVILSVLTSGSFIGYQILVIALLIDATIAIFKSRRLSGSPSEDELSRIT